MRFFSVSRIRFLWCRSFDPLITLLLVVVLDLVPLSTKTEIFVFNALFIYGYCLDFYIVSELVDIRIWENFAGGNGDFCSFCALREHINLSMLKSGNVISPRKIADNVNSILWITSSALYVFSGLIFELLGFIHLSIYWFRFYLVSSLIWWAVMSLKVNCGLFLHFQVESHLDSELLTRYDSLPFLLPMVAIMMIDDPWTNLL